MNRWTACQVLGVDPVHATHKDVRLAFRRLALLHHPDKAGGQDAHFKRVNEAYQYLITRGAQDGPDTRDDASLLQTAVAALWRLMVDAYSRSHAAAQEGADQNGTPSAASNYDHNHDKRRTTQGAVMHLDLSVSIEDVHQGRCKRIDVRVRRWQEAQRRFALTPHTLLLSLFNFQPQHMFCNVGDEFFESDGSGGTRLVRGDIQVQVTITPEHDPGAGISAYQSTIISLFDLHVEKSITLHDYYTASEIEFTAFGTNLQAPYSRGQTCAVLPQHGLPHLMEDGTETRGDVYVFFTLELPNEAPPAHVLNTWARSAGGRRQREHEE